MVFLQGDSVVRKRRELGDPTTKPADVLPLTEVESSALLSLLSRECALRSTATSFTPTERKALNRVRRRLRKHRHSRASIA